MLRNRLKQLLLGFQSCLGTFNIICPLIFRHCKFRLRVSLLPLHLLDLLVLTASETQDIAEVCSLIKVLQNDLVTLLLLLKILVVDFSTVGRVDLCKVLGTFKLLTAVSDYLSMLRAYFEDLLKHLFLLVIFLRLNLFLLLVLFLCEAISRILWLLAPLFNV